MKNDVKMYSGFPKAIAKLNTLPSNLFLYLVFDNRDNGFIKNDSVLKEDFLEKMKEQDIIYAYNSLDRAFIDLTNSGLLVRLNRGRYEINKKIVQK